MNYPNLIKLINATYTDQVEQIIDAKVADNGDILCIAQDGPKQLAIKITDTDISIRLLNPKAIAGNNPTFGETDPQSTPTAFANTLGNQANGIVGDWVEQVKQLLDESGDLASFADRLAGLYPNLPAAEFSTILTDALSASALSGYYEANANN